MKTETYYVENCYAGRFAIVNAELIELVKGKKTKKVKRSLSVQCTQTKTGTERLNMNREVIRFTTC